jgi:ABC-type dipeptide/oligopeptide/nickel transport system permease subunit
MSDAVADRGNPPSRSSVTYSRPERRRPGLLRRLLTHRSGVVGLAILIVFAVVAVVGPATIPFDPIRQDLRSSLLPPSPLHPLGTDQLGRDVLARLAYGARYSLTLGVAAVAIGLLVGVPIGAVSGYFGGWLDLVIQRVTDAVLAFPGILLALVLVAGLGVGLENVVIAVGVSSVPGFIRLVRASALRAREYLYVEAARSIGARDALIVRRHVLPSAIPAITVQASNHVGSAILVAAGLGFLGLGIQPPTPEWGTMLAEARNSIFSHPDLATFPGLAIALSVLAFNLLGDALRDVLDPRLG